MTDHERIVYLYYGVIGLGLAVGCVGYSVSGVWKTLDRHRRWLRKLSEVEAVPMYTLTEKGRKEVEEHLARTKEQA